MKKITKSLLLLVLSLSLVSVTCLAQNATQPTDPNNQKNSEMKTYVIERNIPGAGQFTPEKLKEISKTSCSVLRDMGPGIQWVQSYVTADKVFCVYKAENMDLLREHAKKGGFPINAIYEVSSVISPATAN